MHQCIAGCVHIYSHVVVASTCSILEACGRQDIPVHSGAAKAIVSSVSEERWEGHGPDGLGGESGMPDAAASSLLAATRKNDAVHTLVDLAHEFKGELVVIVLGPMTNVALATLIDPSFLENVKQLVVMGGLSRGEGNLTDHSEFNVGCDPEATSIVYQHSTAEKLHVVPLETTMDHTIPWTIFDQVFPEHSSNANAMYIRRIWRFTKSFTKENGFTPCDAYAMAMLLHPEYVKTAKALKGSIHLAPDAMRGASLWDEGDSKSPNVTLITEVDTEIFVELLRSLTQ